MINGFSSPSDRIVTIFGGSGFIGRHLVRVLARDGWRVRVATRRPDSLSTCNPWAKSDKFTPFKRTFGFPSLLSLRFMARRLRSTWLGFCESGKQSFDRVQAQGAAAVAEAVKNAGHSKVVHVSAIGADANSASAYARSKAQGEAAVLAATPMANILRPSVVFGPEDDFFNRFASMARLMPALPLIGGGATKLQPVYVVDVATAASRLLSDKGTPGAVYELGGPSVRSLREIMEFVLLVIQRRRGLLPMSFGLASTVGGISEIANKILLGSMPSEFVLTRDQVELLKHHNGVSAQAVAEDRSLSGLGVMPELIEAIVPAYLYRFRKGGQFADQRNAS